MNEADILPEAVEGSPTQRVASTEPVDNAPSTQGTQATVKVAGATTGPKVIRIPDWYPYLMVPIFAAMMATAIANFDIVLCASCACFGIVALKIMTVPEAVRCIELEVYIMVAFSLGLGAAMEKSGLAELLGYFVSSANIRGFPLFLLIAATTGIITNVVTNKACAQVMFPIVYSIYHELGIDPMAGVMLLVVNTSMALCTPYGFATNLIIMGPGGYTPKDFVKFGLPLNLFMIVATSLMASISYNQW